MLHVSKNYEYFMDSKSKMNPNKWVFLNGRGVPVYSSNNEFITTLLPLTEMAGLNSVW